MFELANRDNMVLLAIAYIVVALFFLIWPEALKRFNHIAKRWISIRRITKPLDIMRDVDEQIFKISKIIGTLSLILALIFIYLYLKY